MNRFQNALGVLLLFSAGNALAQTATNTFPASGNVGIGTTSTPYTLTVNGTLGAVGQVVMTPSQGEPRTVEFNSTTAASTYNTETGGVYINPVAKIGLSWYGNYWWLNAFRSDDTPMGDFSISYGTTDYLRIQRGGNIGIGTATPGNTLDVNGGIQTSALNSGFAAMTLGDHLSSPGNKGWLLRAEADASPWQGLPDSLDLEYWNGTNGSIPVTFSASGAVGIGTTTPGAKLEVSGSMKLTAGSGGSITFQDGSVQTVAYTGVTCGGDYAESVDVTGNRTNYEPGDVLVIDPNIPGKFLKSADPYSTSVSGIYSTKPGTVGRRQTTAKNPDEVPMAVVGIVPAKVSAENGAIHPGDLLVSSSKVGYGMKGTDRSRLVGAVIGKAMGSLENGTGVIEVLVTLQ